MDGSFVSRAFIANTSCHVRLKFWVKVHMEQKYGSTNKRCSIHRQALNNSRSTILAHIGDSIKLNWVNKYSRVLCSDELHRQRDELVTLYNDWDRAGAGRHVKRGGSKSQYQSTRHHRNRFALPTSKLYIAGDL